MSETLRLMENEVQLAALAFMVVVYILRVVWLMRFRRTRERTFPEGRASRGAGLSLMNIALPWAMESTRRKPLFYLQFVIFHLGVTAAITATFIIPYNPEFFENPLAVRGFQAIIGAAFLVGLYRLWRRLSDPRIRAISTPDDYASLLLMIAYFAAGILAVPNKTRSLRGAAPHFLRPDGPVPRVRAVLQDRALPLLPVRPRLPRPHPRPSGRSPRRSSPERRFR